MGIAASAGVAGGCISCCCLGCFCHEAIQRHTMKNVKEIKCVSCRARSPERLCHGCGDQAFCKTCYEIDHASGMEQYHTYLEIGPAIQHGGKYPSDVAATEIKPLKSE